LGQVFFPNPFCPSLRFLNYKKDGLIILMSTQLNFQKDNENYQNSQNRVKVTDLLTRLNDEKKIEKKRNLALGVAAVSAVTVFGIILTI
tara:strand:+ start:229 stop:495 length:267 start_codon:yes stop_codon:yes gene_type:complete